MKKYGKLLMHKSPELTAKFLMELCTDFKPSNPGVFGKDQG